MRAGFWNRLGGLLLDGILYGLVMLPFAIGSFVAIVAVGLDDCYTIDDELYCPPGAVNGAGIALGVLLGVAGLALVVVLYVRALGRTGQTWGRKIAGLRVVRKDTLQPIGVGAALGRSLFAWFISGNLCYLGYLWMLWDSERQTWHDKIVGSIVVKG